MFRQSALCLFVIVLCWSGVSSSAMPADPPKSAELIKQLTTALDQEKSAVNLDLFRCRLAEALALAGEYGSAKQQADRCTGYLKAQAHRLIWETELARGLNPPLPTKPAENPQAKATDTFLPETYTRALERAGRSADVDRLLLMLDGSVASTYARIEALLFLVEDHLAAGRLPQARQRLDQAIAQFPNYVKNRRLTNYWSETGPFDRWMRAAHALGAKDFAASLRDQFSTQLESRSQGRNVGETEPSDWSALGLWSFQTGEPAKGEAAFTRALKDLEVASKDKDSRWHDPRRRLDVLAAIAVRQFQAGLKREATETTTKLLGECDQIAIRLRGFNELLIAQRLADAGDFDDALLVLARIPSAYYQALTSVALARQATKKNDKAQAKALLIAARELAGKLKDPNELWRALYGIAEVEAAAGNREAASKFYAEAAAVVARQKDQTAYQNIALSMIKAGFFAEAHETLGRVPKSMDRLLPLCELTLETARREFPLPDVKR